MSAEAIPATTSRKITTRLAGLPLAMLLAAGCAPRQAVRPAVSPDLDEAGRLRIFEEHRLSVQASDRGLRLPLVAVGPDVRFTRSDGSYNVMQVNDLMRAYPASAELARPRWGALVALAAVDVGVATGIAVALVPANLLLIDLALIDGLFGLPFAPLDEAEAWRRANAYNAGLAAELGLPAPEPVVKVAGPAGAGWLRGSLCFEGFVGMNVQSRGDLDRWYGGTIDWGTGKRQARALWGGSIDYALTDRFQIGVQWEPFLPKRTVITYASGNTDTWRLDAAGLLGRIRAFRPLGPKLGLVFSGAAGRYALEAASLKTTYWFGARELTGSAIGGKAELAVERLLTRTSGIQLGLGYRFARIRSNDLGPRWAAPSRNDPVDVDHSGPYFATTYRFYWGIARR